jgi:hypothetical protein
MKNDNITAFAFKTGKLIESIIDQETDSLREKNQFLEGRLLQFRQELYNRSCKMDLVGAHAKGVLQKFDKIFEIEINRQGKI